MKRYFLVFIISAVFTVTVSGCVYNSSYMSASIHAASLTKHRINKLNDIMFAYLDIPKEINFIAPPTIRKAGNNNFYRPSAVVQIVKPGSPGVNSNTAKIVNTVPAGKNKKAITAAAEKKQLSPFTVSVKNNALFLTVFTKKPADINKTFKIGGVAVTVKNIRYDKGYEVISLSLVNSGPPVTASENFKYSNAGNTFMVKRFETIENLTVANRYKQGEALCLKF